MNLRKDHYGFERGSPPRSFLRFGVPPGLPQARKTVNLARSATASSPTGTRLASRGRGFKDLPVSTGRRPSGALPTARFFFFPSNILFVVSDPETNTTKRVQLLAVDHSARASMKNAASCEN